MRRALELAEGALRYGRALPARNFAEQRQRLARTIIDRARAGQTDPLTLSAAAVGAMAQEPASQTTAAFRPRGPRMRRSPRRITTRSQA